MSELHDHWRAENDAHNKWLENLQVGDEVYVSTTDSRDYLTKVVRFTKTLIVTTNDGKFKRSGEAPGEWTRSHILEPTEERKLKLTQEKYARLLTSYRGWQQLPLETLKAVYNLLPKKEQSS